MNSINSTVNAASSAPAGSVQGAVAMAMMKQAMQQQASTAAQLLEGVAQPPALATSGSVGTKLNVVA